jgi:O-antigen ligase
MASTLLALAFVAACLLAGGYYESTYSLLAALVWLGLAVAATVVPLRPPSAAGLALGAFAGWTAASALWGPAAPALRLAPLAALYAGWLWASEQFDRETLLRIGWTSCVAVSALALPFYRGGRLDWPVTYANGLGLVAGTGLLLSLGRRSRLGAAVCTLALILTFSRAAIIATVVGAVVLLALEGRIPRRAAVAGAAALAVLAVLTAQPLAARFAGPAPDERNAHRLLDVSGHGRTDLWRSAWEQGLDNPVAGGGAGTWAQGYLEGTARLTAPANAHSLPLETFAELGLIGVGLLAAFVVLVARGARREPVAAAVVAAWLVQACVDWVWQLPAATLPMVFAAAALGPRRARGSQRRGLWFAVAALAIGAACALQGVHAALRETGPSPGGGMATSAMPATLER